MTSDMTQISMKKDTTIKNSLRRMHACPEAIKAYGDYDLESAWTQCNRGDWLLWFAARIHVERNTTLRAACMCARTSLKFIKDPRVCEAIETTEAWIDGKATIDQVHAAAAGADAAAYAASAASVAYAADAAASGDMAELVRGVIPFEIVKQSYEAFVKEIGNGAM